MPFAAAAARRTAASAPAGMLCALPPAAPTAASAKQPTRGPAMAPKWAARASAGKLVAARPDQLRKERSDRDSQSARSALRGTRGVARPWAAACCRACRAEMGEAGQPREGNVGVGLWFGVHQALCGWQAGCCIAFIICFRAFLGLWAQHAALAARQRSIPNRQTPRAEWGDEASPETPLHRTHQQKQAELSQPGQGSSRATPRDAPDRLVSPAGPAAGLERASFERT